MSAVLLDYLLITLLLKAKADLPLSLTTAFCIHRQCRACLRCLQCGSAKLILKIEQQLFLQSCKDGVPNLDQSDVPHRYAGNNNDKLALCNEGGEKHRARKECVMAKNEHTSAKAGKAASNVLRDGRTGKDSKTAAGSALSQRPDKKKK